MNTIDDFIRNNKELFEEEPSEGHFERFNAKLEKRFQKNGATKSIVPYLLKAAVVTLLVTLSSLWTWDHFIRPDRNRMTLGEVSPQYKEAENYYLYQVKMMEDEISSVNLFEPEHKFILMDELHNMDSVYIQLQKELKANPNDERIINAMIEHYQTKIEVLSFIVNQLKEIKNENHNNTKDEKVSI